MLFKGRQEQRITKLLSFIFSHPLIYERRSESKVSYIFLHFRHRRTRACNATPVKEVVLKKKNDHPQVVLRARIFLSLSRHPSQTSIAFGRSRLHPVSI